MRIRRADEREMLSRGGHFFDAEFDVNGLRSFDAAGEQSDEAVALFDGGEQFADLLLVLKFRSGGELRGAADVNDALSFFAEEFWIAEHQRGAGEFFVAFAIARELSFQVSANGFERPARIVAIQMVGDAVEFRLRENALRANAFVARDAAAGDEHDKNAILRQEKETNVFNLGARERRRNDDAESARNGGEDLTGAFHDALGSGGGVEFAANPLAVLEARSGLGGDLFNVKAVGGGGRNASGGRVRLVEVAALFEIGHDVAHGGGAEGFGVNLRDGTRGDRLTGFDVGADDFGEHLAVAFLL